MTAQELTNLSDTFRDLIKHHMEQHGLNPHSFTNKVNAVAGRNAILPPQLYLFLSGKGGLTTGTVEVIAKAMV